MQNDYTPPESALLDQAQTVYYGGFWSRVLASIMDSIWMMIFTSALLWLIWGASQWQTEQSGGLGGFLLSYGLPFALTLTFWVVKGATPGKMIMGLIIVDARTLERASTTRLLVRYLSYFISMLPLFLGIFWVAFDKRKQGWHDKIAGTLVIKKLKTVSAP